MSARKTTTPDADTDKTATPTPDADKLATPEQTVPTLSWPAGVCPEHFPDPTRIADDITSVGCPHGSWQKAANIPDDTTQE